MGGGFGAVRWLWPCVRHDSGTMGSVGTDTARSRHTVANDREAVENLTGHHLMAKPDPPATDELARGG